MKLLKRPNKQNGSVIRRGFWIMESAIAVAVIGVGVVAVVGSWQAWHIQAVISDRIATGMRLAIEIRELSLILPANDPVTRTTTWGIETGEIIPIDIDDLDDLDDAVFNGPIDATKTSIAGMDDWTQQITVQCVNPFNVLQIIADGTSEVVHIRVIILFEGEEVTRLSWIAPR